MRQKTTETEKNTINEPKLIDLLRAFFIISDTRQGTYTLRTKRNNTDTPNEPDNKRNFYLKHL